MRLMRDLILVKPEEAEETWEGGIIVKTDTAKIPPPKGTVLSVGPDVSDIKVGDVVIYGKFAVQEFNDDVLVCEDDVLAVMEGGGA